MGSREQSESKPSSRSRKRKLKSARAKRKTVKCTVKMCECGCGRECKRRFIQGHNRKNWKGGTSVGSRLGYKRIWMPKHPRATSNGYVYEHIVIAEKALGRPLEARHPVHHAGKDRMDNSKLVICEDQSYHMLLHERAKKLLPREYDYLDYLEEEANVA